MRGNYLLDLFIKLICGRIEVVKALKEESIPATLILVWYSTVIRELTVTTFRILQLDM